MDIKQVKLLVKLMMEGDLSELDLADGDKKIHLKRGAGQMPVVVSALPAAAPSPLPSAAPANPAPAAAETHAEQLIDVKSPMVGTFYAAPSPDSEPFVELGAAVNSESVVCIVEAMKVMNEIKAECSGIIREVCVKNAQPVEFGQVMFRVKPA